MPAGTRNSMIKGCGVHHIALQTRDWEASLRLYRDVLGMPVVAEFGTAARPIVLVDIGDGGYMELFAPTPDTTPAGAAAPNDPVMHLALTSADTRQAIEHVRQAGYEITVEPKQVQLGPIAAVIGFFRGPNGEIIEFFQTESAPV